MDAVSWANVVLPAAWSLSLVVWVQAVTPSWALRPLAGLAEVAAACQAPAMVRAAPQSLSL